jgi:hypothetical protein
MKRPPIVFVFLGLLDIAGIGCIPKATTGEAGGSGGRSSGGSTSSTGGLAGAGGAASGGSQTSSSGASVGGAAGSGGRSGSERTTGSGGAPASGGAAASGGRTGTGGRIGTGGSTGSGGAGGTGGMASTGGTGPAGETTATGGTTSAGSCSISITSGAMSSKMPTVGVVEWTTTLSNASSAQIVYTLNNADAGILNKGGTAPVNLKNTSYRTLLLGLKPSSTYTFHVEATSSSGTTCKSADSTLTTGTLSGAPTVTRTATKPQAQANGFIVACGGIHGGNGVGGFILDADGTVVWYSAGPKQCSRAHMDYEGVNMWMLSLNVGNSGGEMRFVSMDGQNSKTQVGGLTTGHHDFTVLPGKIAAMAWAASGADPESNLVEMASDGSGSPTTMFKIGSNLYVGGTSMTGGGSNTYHANYILYHPTDDSYTIADRNPNVVVKVKHDGTPVWQIGGNCTSAKAPKCASGTWQVNHGHDFDGAGNMLIFNNGRSGSAHVLELKVTETTSAISFTTVKDFTPGGASTSMGDVQFLPNGNMLLTVSSDGFLYEVDSSWGTVQKLTTGLGYAEWRESLYGPPSRK